MSPMSFVPARFQPDSATPAQKWRELNLPIMERQECHRRRLALATGQARL